MSCPIDVEKGLVCVLRRDAAGSAYTVVLDACVCGRSAEERAECCQARELEGMDE